MVWGFSACQISDAEANLRISLVSDVIPIFNYQAYLKSTWLRMANGSPHQ